jgi:hypothetical protein
MILRDVRGPSSKREAYDAQSRVATTVAPFSLAAKGGLFSSTAEAFPFEMIRGAGGDQRATYPGPDQQPAVRERLFQFVTVCVAGRGVMKNRQQPTGSQTGGGEPGRGRIKLVKSHEIEAVVADVAEKLHGMLRMNAYTYVATQEIF